MVQSDRLVEPQTPWATLVFSSRDASLTSPLCTAESSVTVRLHLSSLSCNYIFTSAARAAAQTFLLFATLSSSLKSYQPRQAGNIKEGSPVISPLVQMLHFSQPRKKKSKTFLLLAAGRTGCNSLGVLSRAQFCLSCWPIFRLCWTYLASLKIRGEGCSWRLGPPDCCNSWFSLSHLCAGHESHWHIDNNYEVSRLWISKQLLLLIGFVSSMFWPSRFLRTDS